MKHTWNHHELTTHWSLNFEELELLKTKPERSHLPFCIQLKYYQSYGSFPDSYNDISKNSVEYLMSQIEIAELPKYDWKSRTAQRHRLEVLGFLGIKKTTTGDRDQFKEWLIDELIPKTSTIKELLSHADEWFFKHKLVKPSEIMLDRLIKSAITKHEGILFKSISDQITSSDKTKIDRLLSDDEKNHDVSFPKLKVDAGKIGLESVVKESDKLSFINSLSLPDHIFKQINQKSLSSYKMRVASQSAWETQRHPDNIRYALTSLFLYMRKAEIIDGLVELLIQIIHRLSVRADNKVKKTLLKDFKKVYGKNHILFQIADAALECPQGKISDVIFPIVGENTLTNLIKEYKSNGPDYKLEVHKVIRASYSSHYRRMIPKILRVLPFRSNNDLHKPVLDAWEFIKANQPSRKTYFNTHDDVPIDGVIQSKWLEVVIEEDNG